MSTRLAAALLVLTPLSVAASENLWPQVLLQTSEGDVVLELDGHRTPHTVRNFLHYARSGHYDGTIFHRVVADFVVQGGGYDAEYEERETIDPVVNESGNGLSNARGTIAMARTNDPHSATSQWYINLKDNTNLDPSQRRWGYTVFGRVTEGMEVIDAIAAIPVQAGPLGETMPHRPVILERVVILNDPE